MDYNGWSNQETWLMSLWIGKDDRAYNLAAQAGVPMLYCRLHDYLDSLDPSLFTDYLRLCVDRVNWSEIDKFIRGE